MLCSHHVRFFLIYEHFTKLPNLYYNHKSVWYNYCLDKI